MSNHLSGLKLQFPKTALDAFCMLPEADMGDSEKAISA